MIRTHRARGARSLTRATFLALPLLVLATAGCGGGGDGTPGGNNGRGQATVEVQWPSRSRAKAASRLIPAAANSIRVSFLANAANGAPGIPVATQLLVRPAGDAPVTRTSFTDLPQGSLAVQAVALPNADGSGTAQAFVRSDVSIVAGQSTPVSLSLQSTIARVDILPVNIALTTEPVTLTAVAYDINGNEVAAARWAWTNSNPAVLSFTPSGNTATAAALAEGEATVTLTEAESGASVSKRFVVSGL